MLPALAGLACPLSMVFMMRGMRRHPGPIAPRPSDAGQAAGGVPAAEQSAEIARLRREIGLLRARAGEVARDPGAGAAAARTGRKPGG